LGRLVQRTGRRELALGLGFIVVRPGRNHRPPKRQPAIHRHRTGVGGNRAAQALAGLCGSPWALGLEGEGQLPLTPA
jgi:hypothetical protein